MQRYVKYWKKNFFEYIFSSFLSYKKAEQTHLISDIKKMQLYIPKNRQSTAKL